MNIIVSESPKGSKNKSLSVLVKIKRSRSWKGNGADSSNQIERDGIVSDDGHVSRKPGRPKGSKNKSMDNEHFRRKVTQVQVKNKRGRPSKSHGADLSNQFERDGTVSDDGHVKRKRGRPKGSKNKSVIIYDQ